MKTESELVENYIAAASSEHQDALRTLRQWILEAAPNVTENFEYGMPTYHVGSKYCSFASNRNYMSIYLDSNVVELYRNDLAGLNIEKNSIRFHSIAELQKSTIGKILEEFLSG